MRINIIYSNANVIVHIKRDILIILKYLLKYFVYFNILKEVH